MKLKNLILSFFAVISFAIAQSQHSIQFTEQTIQVKDNLSFNLKIPAGYKIAIAARGLHRPRFFSKSPDGRLFITDMFNRDDNKKGRVYILNNWNENLKKFEQVTTYLDSLRNPNQIAFYSVNNQTYLFLAETHQLSYYLYHAGDTRPTSKQTIIATFPDYGLNYKYGGWHLTRSLAFHNNKVYVSVGSSCDACIEKEKVRACIMEMNPDGTEQKVYASGLRNAVGIKWINNELWATNMGRDNRGPDKPEELLLKIEANSYYGWPFYFQYKKQIITDVAFKDSVKPVNFKKPDIGKWGIKAHSAPLGFDFFTDFTDDLLNNSFITALHGSTSVWRQRGNAVVQMSPDGSYREIITGFLQGKTEDKRFGRPCDVIQWDNRSFFISDDKNGIIYYVWKEN
ncbi:MAG: PQQ-dependent sugar dehydrogenase [Chitinophagaceae bacterium]